MSNSKKTIGRYEIKEVVGKGSMGIVFRAYDPLEDIDVALKVAKRDVLNDTDQGSTFRKLFYNEARLAGKLKHPAVRPLNPIVMLKNYYR